MAEEVSDTYAERLRNVEFLYAKNDQYKTVDLHFFYKQHDKKYPAVDLLSFDCSKIMLDDKFKICYDNKPCNVSIERIAASTLRYLINGGGGTLINVSIFFQLPWSLLGPSHLLVFQEC